eukprot:GHRQ01037797.1.p1 GENE.GHRQ01037797.1~~GHRQ01037797.1.p1  ORF type:complete len:195 (+),score=32.14 GHRQ01037797.1:621-1205(+)
MEHCHAVLQVLIVDFDVHHGNGTEEIMYSDSSVLYISTHQQGLWPYTGKVHQVGSGGGKGYTINIPLPGVQPIRTAWLLVVPAESHQIATCSPWQCLTCQINCSACSLSVLGSRLIEQFLCNLFLQDDLCSTLQACLQHAIAVLAGTLLCSPTPQRVARTFRWCRACCYAAGAGAGHPSSSPPVPARPHTCQCR